jgi:hypothetical protein
MTAPSGCGKTFSALKVARGLASSWQKVCLIDSEGSGDKYAGHEQLGPYNVINLFEGDVDPKDRFSPKRWIAAMQVAHEAGMEVVILDSASHEWQWCLSEKDNVHKHKTNKNRGEDSKASFYDWRNITPEHKLFIDCIVQCPMHVIVCTRRKTEYVMIDNKVKKAGMKSEMREGFEYDLDIVIGLTMDHYANIEKDRTGIFDNLEPFIPSETMGRQLLAWSKAESLKPETERKNAPISIRDSKVVQRIREILEELKVPEGLWPQITAEVDGIPAGDVRARLEELASEVAEEESTEGAEASRF